jgi:hypothetical protein
MPLKIAGFELTVQVHKAHDLVTTKLNIATAETEILRVVPGENQVLIFPNNNLLNLKLVSSVPAEIGPGSVVSFWRVDATGAHQECFAQTEYTPWHNIDFSEQSKDEYREILGIGFLPKLRGVDAVRISPGYRLEIRLKATTVVDWTEADSLVWFGLAQELLK